MSHEKELFYATREHILLTELESIKSVSFDASKVVHAESCYDMNRSLKLFLRKQPEPNAENYTLQQKLSFVQAKSAKDILTRFENVFHEVLDCYKRHWYEQIAGQHSTYAGGHNHEQRNYQYEPNEGLIHLLGRRDEELGSLKVKYEELLNLNLKMRSNYYKEISGIRATKEMNKKKQLKVDPENQFAAHHFQVTDGLPAELCEDFNHYSNGLRRFFEQRMQQFSNTNQSLEKKVQYYKSKRTTTDVSVGDMIDMAFAKGAEDPLKLWKLIRRHLTTKELRQICEFEFDDMINEITGETVQKTVAQIELKMEENVQMVT